MTHPETRYVKLDGDRIAYQVVGEGPILVYCTGMVSHIDFRWEHPLTARFLERLGSFSRLILFDPRGSGASDPLPEDETPTWEHMMDDVVAVTGAAGAERFAILGQYDAGPMAILFAATQPERVSALILALTTARLTAAADYPIGLPREAVEAWIADVRERWGTEEFARTLHPGHADDVELLRYAARYARVAASPRMMAGYYSQLFRLDVRDALPLVRVPTLVLGRDTPLTGGIAQSRYLAERIPGAVFVELPGSDAALYSENADLALGAIEEFLTGARQTDEAERVLATVLFTDLVGSTDLAAGLGDGAWREVVARHHTAVRKEIARFGGREIDTAGDGFLAAFQRPTRALQCALRVRDAVRALGLEIRAGIHTGECEVVGEKLAGIAVHMGARILGAAGPGEILASSTVRDLAAGSGIRFADRGVHRLRGIPGEWTLLGVE